jgi:hypothetical protein
LILVFLRENFPRDILVDNKERLMKLNIFFLILFVFSTSLLIAQEDGEASGDKVSLSGYVQTDNRMRLKDDQEFSFHEYRLGLKIDTKPNEGFHVFGEVWLRSIGSPDVSNNSDLTEKDKISSINLDFREAYIDVYGFIFEDMDLRAGKQRIAWGTGDNLNPTDNLNPDDIEDIWDFGRHIGSDAIKLTYYLGEFTITGVYIPFFTPAVMPSGDEAEALSSPMEMMPGITIGEIYDPGITLPENNFKEGAIPAIKIARKIFDLDFSISYIYGRDDLPILKKVTITPNGTVMDISSELVYPRMHIAGADMAGSFFDIGTWVEGAIFFPEKVITVTDLSGLGMPNPEPVVALDDKPYVKYVVGGDYNFKNGIYINFQYLHGFIHERGEDNLEDYFMAGMEYKCFDNKLKLIPIMGGVEVKRYHEFKENYAIIYSPGIVYYPVDNVQIDFGVRIIYGKETTAFGRMKDYDEIYLKVKGSF